VSTGSRFTAVLLVLLVALSGCAQLQERFRQVTESPDGGSGSAHEELLAGETDRLLVEISHSPGANFDPETDARKDIRDQVERITQKQVEITASADLPSNGGDYAYSLSELRDFHREHKDNQDTADRAMMHAMFLDGEYERENVAGLAFAGTGFALFKGEIEDKTCRNDALVCNNGVREWKVSRAVAIHEAGHLFGLVDCPLDMVEPHEDPERECHSSNDRSVMYWKVERSGGLDDLIGQGDVPWTFDDKDLKDARALQQG
jgi:predicted Zn-dependent protease